MTLLEWLHERWIPLPKWRCLRLQRSSWFAGDKALPSKQDPTWRYVWPYAVLAPRIPVILLFNESYRLFFQAKDGRVWVKLLPVRGRVAVRIGNEPVRFAACAGGSFVSLRVEQKDLHRRQLPQHVTAA